MLGLKIEKISEKQLKTLNWWHDASPHRDCDAIICDGAVRSGKTLFTAISFVCWAMERFEDKKFAMCGKTIVSLRRNVVSELLPALRSFGLECEEKVSKNEIKVRRGKRENIFLLFGGKDEGSAALIQGVTLAGVLMDEVALQPRSFVEQACARCSVSGSKFWFNCNPEGPSHWFYNEWILKKDERNALYLHFTMCDNPSLTREIRDRYERLYTGVFYRRFILGEWVAAQGRIYDFFDESYVKPAPPEPLGQYWVSCDYGTSNPCSFGLWGERGGVWYRLKEYYFASREEGYQKTDAEYADALADLIGGRNVRGIVVDPSAASFIAELRRRGYAVLKAQNDVLSGIRLTADMLKSGRIVICEGCDATISEFSRYVWNEDAAGDVPKKENDHAMDEIRYFAATVAAAMGGSFAATYVER